jgi:anaerobic selenocysteine-containing dehydrogenase
VADRAAVLDLRIRKARRRGAHVMIVGPGGSLLERDAGTVRQTSGAATAEALAGLVRDPGPLATATFPVLLVTDDVDTAAIAAAAHALGLHERGGVLPLPNGPNERGARLCGLAGGGDEVLAAIEAGTVQAVVLLGVDPTAEWPDADRWQMALAQVRHVICVSPFVNTSVSWSHIVLPQAVDHEREGTTTNLEGRIQRLRPATKPPSGVPDLAAYAAVAAHLGVEISPAPSTAYGQLAAQLGIPLTWSELNGRAPLPARRAVVGAPPAAPPAEPAVPAALGRFTLIAPRSLFSGPAVERTPALAHQRAPWVMLNHEDAARLGVSEHDPVTVRHAAGDHTGPLRTSRRLRAGAVRINWSGPPVSGEAEVVPA